MKNRHYIITIVVLAILVIGYSYLYLGDKEAGLGSIAVESSFGCATDPATTSPAYMTIGAATSTVTCPLTRVGTDAPSTATLLVQLNASSSGTTLNIFIEESVDNIDWYPIPENQHASTSNNPFDLALRPFATLLAASSTIGGNAAGQGTDNRLGVIGGDNRNHYELEIPVRLNYVRAIAGLASSSVSDFCDICVNGAVWMHIIHKVEF